MANAAILEEVYTMADALAFGDCLHRVVKSCRPSEGRLPERSW